MTNTKEQLIDIINNLPDTARIDIDYTVPEPNGVNDYLMELGRKKTNYLLHSQNKYNIAINIEYNK
jgi:hypothetical protein